jgi:hypothetical protein
MHALVNLRTQALSMLEQQQVKFGPVHMIGMVAIDAFLAKLREVQGLLLPVEITPRGAKLLWESGLIHFVDQTQLAEDPHGGEDQRLAHVRPRLVMALQN